MVVADVLVAGAPTVVLAVGFARMTELVAVLGHGLDEGVVLGLRHRVLVDVERRELDLVGVGVQRSSAPTDEDEQDRRRAYREMEEANWEDVAILPLYHYVTESIWYDDVEVPAAGPLDISRQQHTEVRLSDERTE
jgi:hypothetical protein